MRLYDARQSQNSRKVRLVAAELGITLDLIEMDYARGDFQAPEFRAKNPNGMIPTLDDDGFVVWESGAILTYLAAKYPQGQLLPAAPQGRAQVAQWMFWWTAHPESALTRIFWEKRIKPWLRMEGNNPAIIADAEREIARHLPVLDHQLTGRDFIVGDLSIADFAAGPVLEIAEEKLGVPLAPYPNIRRWLARLQSRSYWATA